MLLPPVLPAWRHPLRAAAIALLAGCTLLRAAVPVIVTPPATQRVTVGSSAAFQVVATSAAPVSYQWLKGGTTLVGVTTSYCAIPVVALSDAGSYAVTVTNSDGAVTSAAATLTVNAATTITTTLTSNLASIGPQGGRLTLTAVIDYSHEAPPTALGYVITLPTGWAMVSVSGPQVPDLVPAAGTTARLEFGYTTCPAGRAQFSVVASYPTGLAATQTLQGAATYRTAAVTVPAAPLVFAFDQTPPAAPGGPMLTPVGGTVRANTLNRTNTNLTATATIPAGEGPGAVAQLLVGGAVVATDDSIAATDTAATFSVGTATAAALQAVITAGGAVTVRLVDAAGNASAPGPATSLTVDYTAPTVAITSNVAALLTGQTATLTFTLSEPAADFTAAAVTAAGGTISGFAATSATVYTATFTPAVASTVAGVVMVAANQFTDPAGNGNAAATPLALVVDTTAQYPLITSATTASGTYGSAFAYTIATNRAAQSFTATGLPPGLTLDGANGVITGLPRAAGQFSVGLGAANGAGTGTVTLLLTVAKAPLTVTAGTASRAFGAAHLAVTPGYSGWVNGDTVAALNSAPVVTSTTDASSPVGPYLLVPAGGVSDRYTFNYVAGTLTITAAPAVLLLDNLTQTYSGLGLTPLVHSTPPGVPVTFTFNGSRTAPTEAGSYAVVATAGGNFTGATTGTLVIVAAQQAINITPLSGETALRDYPAPVALSATATSGLPVTLTLGAGSAATLDAQGQLINIQSSGTVTIRANQAGSGNVLPAPEVVLVLDVARRNQGITFDPLADAVYGDSSRALSATSTSGLPPTFSLISGPASLQGNFLRYDGAGEVFVKASAPADGDYNAAPEVVRRVAVTRRFQEISFLPLAAATFGDRPQTLAATATSGLAVTFRVVSGPGALAGDVLAFTGAGTVIVRASQAGNSGLAPAPDVDQTLLVAPAALTVTALPATRAYGDPDPIFALNYAGFVGTDTAAALSTPVVAAAAATRTSPPGTYAINLTGAAAANYAVRLVDGTLTVNKAAQTIVFPALADQTLGNPAISLGAVATSGLAPAYTLLAGPAVLSDATLALTGTGLVSVRATQAGNDNYLAAADVDRSFTVNATPTVVGVAAVELNGSYAAGASVSLLVTFSGPVVVTGSPALALNAAAGRRATYAGGSGSAVLKFTYVVQAGDRSADLDYASSAALDASAATITGLAGAAAVLALPAPGAAGSLAATREIVIDTQAPRLLGFATTTATGTYGVGTSIPLVATMAEPVRAGSALVVRLTTGSTVTLAAASAGAQLTGNYVVGAGENTTLLNVTSYTLASNGVLDLAGNPLVAAAVPTGADNLSGAASITIGRKGPTVVITAEGLRLRAGETTVVRFELSEASVNFTVGSVTVTNGELSGFSGSGRSYGAVYTPVAGVAGEGTVRVEANRFTDLGGNGNVAGGLRLGGEVGYAWARIFGASGVEEGVRVVVDGAGNTTVAGTYSGTVDFGAGSVGQSVTAAGGRDVFIAQLDAQGALRWVRTVGGSGGDEVRGLAQDAAGDLYVAGSFSGQADFDPGPGVATMGANGGLDAYVLKLSGSGELRWVRAIGGSGSDQATAVAVNGAGEVYVGGYYSGTVDFDPGAGYTALTASGATDGFVLKLSGAGELQWAQDVGPAGGAAAAVVSAVALDGAGGVLVLSNTLPGSASFDPAQGLGALASQDGMGTALTRQDASGAVRATQRWSDGILGRSLAVGADGAVTLGGTFRGSADFDPGAGTASLTSAGDTDGFVVRLDAAGAYQWGQRFGGPAADEVHAVTVDDSGLVYVLGGYHGTVRLDPAAGGATATAAGPAEDAFLVKLTGAGQYAWAKTWGGAGEDRGQGLAVDSAGDVYATGRFAGTVDFDPGAGTASRSSGGGSDAYVLHLTTAGTITLDTQAPTVAAVTRQSPQEATVTASGVSYRVRFSREVTGVTAAAFTLTTGGGLSGTLADVAAVSATDYLVTVAPLAGAGTLRLDVKPSGTGIVDLTNNALAGGYTAGEVYTVSAATNQPVLAGAVTAEGAYGSAFSHAVKASGSPLSFTASGLPAGLSLNATTGVISGTPQVAGNFAVSVGAGNLFGSGLGTLVVKIARASLTVSAGAVTRPYGQPNPVLAPSYSGLVAGDTAASLTTAPSVTTTAGRLSAAGTYPLAVGGGQSDQYSFVYQAGTLTIARVPVTIALGNLTQSYTGQGLAPTWLTSVPDVALTWTYNGGASVPVAPGTYAVVAVPTEANYTGGASGTLTITKAEQRITLGALPPEPLKFALLPVPVVATSSRGLPVTLSLGAGSAATLTAERTLVDIGASGTVTIRASQPGDANTLPAEDVVLVVDVAKVNQSVSLALDAVVPYGTTALPFTVSASSGLTPTVTVPRGPGTISGSTVAISAAGAIVVQASQAGNETYNAAPPVTRVLDVSAVAQTITFGALASATYGDAPLRLGGRASSGRPLFYTVLSGPGTIAGGQLTLNGAGEIVVRAGQPGDGNYQAALDVEQTLLVQPRALAVGVQPASRAYGAANPVFVLTYTGLVNGDTAAAIVGPTAASPATATSGPGAYAITLSGGRAANYTLSLGGGTLTVTPAAQTINFPAPPNQALGNAPFTLGAAASSGLAPSYTIVSGPATLAGNTVTLTGAGPVVVRASQPGDANYAAAPEVEQSFTVAGAIGIVGVSSSVGNGAYGAGAEILIEVSFSGLVTVVGQPQLALNTTPARAAVYQAGGGTNVLSFRYTVQAGDNAAALDYASASALTIASAAIRNASGTANAGLALPAPGTAGSLAQAKQLAVDTTAPVLVRVGSPTPAGAYKAGAQLALQATMSEAVQAGGTLALTLDTGAVVTLTAPRAGPELSGTYTVAAGQNSARLTVASYTAGTVRDLAGNALTATTLPAGPDNLGGAKALAIATGAPAAPEAPVVTPVGGTLVANTLNATNTNLTVTAAIPAGAAAGGSARLLLGPTVLASAATIAPADTSVTFDLGTATAAALQAALPQGGPLSVVLRDAAGNDSAPGPATSLAVDFLPPALAIACGRLVVPVGSSEPVSFTLSKAATNFVLGSMAVTGGTLTNLTGSGTSYSARFTPAPGPGGAAVITVAAGGFTDAAGNPNAAATFGLTVDPAATVAAVGVSSSNADGAYQAGRSLSLQVTFADVVNVTGTPTLALATVPARTAAYTTGAGTPVLTFTYVVQAGDTAERLDYAAATALGLNGGTIANLSGRAAILTLPAPGAAGSLAAAKALRIDTAAPRVVITSDRLSLKAGETARLTFALSERATDFAAADVAVTNGTLTGFSGSGTAYTATLVPASGLTGAATVRVPAGGFSDAAGNGNLAGELTLVDDVRLAWVRGWGGNGPDEALATALDASGNVYVAGRFTGTVDFDPGTGVTARTAAGETDGFVGKLDALGNLLWVQVLGGAGADAVRALAIDAAGNVCLAGTFSGTATLGSGTDRVELTAAGDTDVVVAKLEADGRLAWARGVGGAGAEAATALVIDRTGGITVGGSFSGQADFDPGPGGRMLSANGGTDAFLLRLDAGGLFQWVASFGGAGDDQVNGLALDGTGGVYAAGSFRGTVDFDPGPGLQALTAAGGADAFLARFDAGGVLRWVKRFGGAGNDQAAAVAALADGGVAIGGSFEGEGDFDPGAGSAPLTAAGERNGFVVRLDAAGEYAWSRRLGATGAADVRALAADAAGAVYVAGGYHGGLDLGAGAAPLSATSTGPTEDAFLAKLNAAGAGVWLRAWGGAADAGGAGLALDAAGDIFAAGRFGGTANLAAEAGTAALVAAGNDDALAARWTTRGTIAVDTQAPEVAAVTRQSPLGAAVTAGSVSFRVRFSREVTGVAPAAFALTASGATGTIADVTALSGTDYVVTVDGLTGSGTLRLDVKASGTAIADTTNNPLAGGYAAGEVYTLTAATTQPVISGAVTATASYGSPFSYAITASRSPLSFTATGLPAGLVLDPAKGTITGTPRVAGGFAVVLGAQNLSGVGGGALVLKVAKATLTVTAVDAVRPYGQANPGFAVNYSGFANGDSAATLPTGPVVTTTAGTFSAAGTYPLIASGGQSDKYAFAYRDGTLTVATVPVAIALGDLTQSYTGQGLTPLLQTSVSDVALTVTYNGSLVPPVTPGSYAVVASPTLSSYAGSASGTLVIMRAPQSILLAPLPTEPLAGLATKLKLEATASSGLPVTLALEAGSVGVLNSTNQLEGIGTSGTVLLHASQAGDANYLPAPDVVLAVDVAKRNQGINFPAPASVSSGSATIALQATATSDLPVDFSVVSGPASVSAGVLTPQGVGTVVVKARQAGNEGYNPAQEVFRAITFIQSAQAITFPNVTPPVYGDAPIALRATATSGLPVAYTVVRGPATVQNSVLTCTGAGEIVVRASQPGDSATGPAVPVEQSIVVAPRELTVTATGAARAYGEANPLFGVTYQGFAGAEAVTVLEVRPSVATMAEVNSAPGTYVLTLGGGVAANYRFKYVPGALTIAPAAQTLAFPPLPRQALGNAPFTLGAVATSGLAPVYSIVSGLATVAGNIVTLTGAGTVVVRASQPGDANYLPAAAVEQSFAVESAIGIVAVTSPMPDGAYRAGQRIDIDLSFSGVVTVVAGTPTLQLNAGAAGATYVSGSGTSTLSFRYTVQLGDNVADLDYASAHALTGAIANAAGTASPALTLAGPGAPGSLGYTRNFRIDTSAPGMPTLIVPSPTALVRPTLGGAAEAGAMVEVFAGANLVARAVAAANGAWTAVALADWGAGSHLLTARATDAAGNAGLTTAVVTVVVNTATPAAPVITSTLPVNLLRPVLAGTAAAGETVRVYDAGVLLGSAVAAADGTWQLEPGGDLAAGAHALTATATNEVGTTGPASASVTLIVDVTPPRAPTIANGGTMPGTNAVFRGTAEADSVVTLYDGTVAMGSAKATANGEWSLVPAAALTNGARTFTATARDAAGNVSPLSAPVGLILDSYAPDAPFVDTTGIFNTATPVIVGRGESLARVRVFDGNTLLGIANVSANGTWSLQPAAALTEGAHRLAAVAVDAAGNVGIYSATQTIVVDTVAPAAPVVTPATFNAPAPTVSGTAEAGSLVQVTADGTAVGAGRADSAGAWSIRVNAAMSGGGHQVTATATDIAGNQSPPAAPALVTIDLMVVSTPSFSFTRLYRNIRTPVISGAAAAGQTVTVYDSGTPIGAVLVASGGVWSLTPAAPLADGTHTLTATAQSGAQVSAVSAAVEIVIVTQRPPSPSFMVNSTVVTSTPTLSGQSDPGVTVRVFAGPTSLGFTMANATGNWSFRSVTVLAEGIYQLTATATDAAGNVSDPSLAIAYTVDLTAPVAPVPAAARLFNTAAPALAGTAESGARVVLMEGAVEIGRGFAGSSGAWSIVPAAALAEGGHALAATATDVSGNVSPAATYAVTIDLTAPARPTLAGPANVNALRPTVQGTAEAGASVRVANAGVDLGAVAASAAGTWSLSLAGNLASGPNTLTAVAVDPAGNRSDASLPLLITVDLTPPAAPQIATTGTLTSSRPTVTGTAEALATVRLQEGAIVLGTATTTDAGQWSLVLVDPLWSGPHTLTAYALDAAGNASGASLPVTLTISLAAPATPVIETTGAVNLRRPVLTGLADAGSEVRVYDGAALLGTATAAANGRWSLTLGSDLASGVHPLTATATNKTANTTSETSAAAALTIDFDAPVAPSVSAPGAVSQSRPPISGTAEAATIVAVYDGAVRLGTATAAATGEWSLVPAAALAEGTHRLTAVATDPAGNASGPSAAVTLVVDTVAPAAPSFDAVPSPTAVRQLRLSGQADAGATVRVLDGTLLLGAVPAGADGKWSLTVASALSQGPHALVATATDSAGNASPPATASIQIDSVPPSTPTVEAVATIVAAPVLRGTYDPNDTVLLTVSVNGRTYSSATGAVALNRVQGLWSLGIPLAEALREGTYAVTVVAVDLAGNAATDMTSAELLIGTTAVAPIADPLPQPASPTAMRIMITDTSSRSLDLSGRFVDPLGRTLTFVVLAAQNVSATVFGTQLRLVFPAGFSTQAAVKLQVMADPDDAAKSATYTLTIAYDGDADAIADGVENVAGDLNGDGQADSAQSAVSSFPLQKFGSGADAPVSDFISIIVGDRNTAAPGADRKGVVVDSQAIVSNATVTPVAEFGAAPQSWTPVTPVIQFEITNAVPQPDGSVVVVIALPSGMSPPDHIYKYGYERPGDTVKSFFLFDYDGWTGGSLIDTNGDGKPDIVRLVYRDGMRGDDDAITNGIIVDPIVLGGPLVTTAAPRFAALAPSKTAVPTIAGTAAAGATIRLYQGASLLGSTTASNAGVWTIALAVPLADGTWPLTATAELPPATASAAVSASIVIDTVAPLAPTVTPFTANSAALEIQGTAEAASTVRVFDETMLLGTVTASATGSWTLATTLSAGVHALTADATDAVGNRSAPSVAAAGRVQPGPVGGGDRVVPAPAPVTVTLGDLNQAFAGTPRRVSAITAPAGLDVAISYGGASTAPTAVGSYPVVATVTTAGYQGGASGTLVISPAAQTLAFTGPASALAGQAVTLAATASSGLPVTLTVVRGAATLAGNALTPLAAGTVVVRASQGGDASYLPAPAIERTVLVTATGPQVYLGVITAADGTTRRGDIAAVLAAGGAWGEWLLVLPGSGLSVALRLNVSSDGSFTADLGAEGAIPPSAAGAASPALTLRGTVRDGVMAGSIQPLDVQFSVAVAAPSGPRAGSAGYFPGQALGTDVGTLDLVVGPQGQAMVVAVAGGVRVGGVTTLAADGSYTLPATAGAVLRGAVNAADMTTTGTLTIAGQPPVNFTGVAATAVRTGRLVNLSALTRAGAGEKMLISGFAIRGPESRTVIVRGIGPSLAGFGVKDAIANPRLRLLRGAELVAENDDWSADGDAAALAAGFARVGAFPLALGSTDAALSLTLPPGSYTVQVTDATGEGTALAEVYDATTGAAAETPRLANISTRGEIGAGGQGLAGGFVVAGNHPKRILVRAIGPGLAAFGVNGVLADPRVAVYSGGTVLAQNNDWGAAPAGGEAPVVASAAEIAAAAQATGAFALAGGSKDAALLVTLAPGAYTAQVTAADGNATGVALVEIYELPD